MRLLICTQTVDHIDPILGFFHRWIVEFAAHYEQVSVICLEEGRHTLPSNVRVYSLGKEQGAVSRLQYALRFWRLLWQLRGQYDTVFVHMNPEYLILGGAWWRIAHKKVALWYTHKSVNLRLRVAALFAHIIFTASKESFRLSSNKVHVVGHGIDTDFFSPDTSVLRTNTVLSVGRLSPTKRHDLVIRAAALSGQTVRIIGDGPERGRLEQLARQLGVAARIQFLGGLTQELLRYEYRSAQVLVHTSETGSVDKVVLEALACGLPVVSTSTSLGDVPVVVVDATPEEIAKALVVPHTVDASYVRTRHSLAALVSQLVSLLAAQ